MLKINLPVTLFAGENCVKEHRDAIAKLGRSCLIVTGRTSAVRSGALSDLTEVLSGLGISCSIFNGITENPTVEACRKAGLMANEAGAAFIVGIGGGSPMDAAKAAAVFAADPYLNEEGFYKRSWDKALPIVLIGTTSGTGSEVTDVSVLMDSAGRKHSMHDPEMFAALAFGDYRYTLSLPLGPTVSAGLDILAHAAESYFSVKAHTLSRLYSTGAVKLACAHLKSVAAASKPSEIPSSAREALYEASILAGLAIRETGTAFPHNVGYYLTEAHNVPHGIASATFLPELMKHVAVIDPALTEAFYRDSGVTAEEFAELLDTLLPDAGVRMSEEEILGVLPRWADNRSVKNTIGNVTAEKIGAILRSKFLYSGR